jgi:methylated-DNA-protein-cysteine methyltransferase related protein
LATRSKTIAKPKLVFSDVRAKTTKTSASNPKKLNPDDVYAMVKRIPKGRVATYGQIAALIGMPRHSRHVGNALSALPTTVKIPWQRVVNAQGRVSLRLKHWDSGSDTLQRILLESEGVVFSESGKIDLEAFGWRA